VSYINFVHLTSLYCRPSYCCLFVGHTSCKRVVWLFLYLTLTGAHERSVFWYVSSHTGVHNVDTSRVFVFVIGGFRRRMLLFLTLSVQPSTCFAMFSTTIYLLLCCFITGCFCSLPRRRNVSVYLACDTTLRRPVCHLGISVCGMCFNSTVTVTVTVATATTDMCCLYLYYLLRLRLRLHHPHSTPHQHISLLLQASEGPFTLHTLQCSLESTAQDIQQYSAAVMFNNLV
jgi:hypothetical protein